MKYRVWLSILLCTSLLAGCSLPFDDFWERVRIHREGKGDTLGLTPDFSYDIEEQTPNILINQLGYEPEASKIAILQGKELEYSFQVHDAVTNEIVYEGTLEKTGTAKEYIRAEDEDIGETGGQEVKNLYLADFSKVEKPGEYYIFQPDLGYSYRFLVKAGIYQELEKEVLTLLQEENRNTSQICYQLAGLLMTEELYGEYTEELVADICREKITTLMYAQDTGSGSVYAEIPEQIQQQDELTQQEHQQMVSLAATAEFAGVMAMYSNYIQETDTNFARECRNAAEKAYRSIQDSLDNVSYDAGYFAAAQLYRLTGKNKYEQAVGQYLFMQEEQKSYTEYDFSLFGDLAYLSSKSGVNLEWSEMTMKQVMLHAVQIADASSRNYYYISQEREYYDIDGLLQDMSVMALVNYIITNHEYTILQKNYLDYMLGRNPGAVCMVDGLGTRNAAGGEGINQQNSALFYLLLQSTKVESVLLD